MNPEPDATLAASTKRIFDEQRRQTFRRTDRLFAALMVLQWFGGIVAALVVSPRTWSGAHSAVHPHVWLAIGLGGALAAGPIVLALRYPGRRVTRHVIGVCQILFSSLFIHISGGRIETHFHVFGSLAFLAFYRDWQVLVAPTVLVALDHFVRGVYWPETVFGVGVTSPWRWLEHAAWVVFEDVFLVISCVQGVRESWDTARRTAEIERQNGLLAERALQLGAAYESNRAIIDTALDAVIGMDSRGQISGWNSNSEKLFGWTAAEVMGKQLSDVMIPPKLRSGHEEGFARYRRTGESLILNKRVEVFAIDRSGREFPIELAIAPIHTAQGISFSAFVRDIAERREAADALKSAKEAAEAANRAKSAFLANMSHEIRTPLNAVLGFADIMLRTEDKTSADERKEYIGTILESGRHLLRIINDVLDLSKVESGQMEVEQTRCGAHQIIADVVSLLRVRAKEKGIELESRWESRVPETILADPARLRQIVMNLVGNAVKFTETGEVSVVARIDESSPEPRLVIDICDTGIGIPAEYLPRLFQPFSQADQSITRRFGGTGLGLTISRQLARQMGGDVTVQSEIGKGSRFTVTIVTGPLSDVAWLEAPVSDVIPKRITAAGSLRPLPHLSILLVEDGPTNRKLVTLMLERAGARVVTAENGRVGVDLARQERFDVILMDMQMPVLDGYLATAELRRLGLTLPIIALTAHSMKGDEERCRAAGCSGYVTKPIDTDRLLAAVAEAVGSREADVVDPAADERNERPITSTLPVDDAAFLEIVEEFVGELPARLETIRCALESGDFESAAQVAHWLKGSGGTAGFASLSLIAARLEHAAKTRDKVAAVEALERTASLVQRIAITPAPVGA